MKEMKIEWVFECDFLDRQYASNAPVVRLAAVDQVLAEAVWAMEYASAHAWQTEGNHGSIAAKAQAFLASNTVAQWRERQKGTS